MRPQPRLVIDHRFALEEGAEAFRYLPEGHAPGEGRCDPAKLDGGWATLIKNIKIPKTRRGMVGFRRAMNYYEQIQQAIDFMEERLSGEVLVQEVARHSGLSQAGLYRLFFALTGHQVMEYLRLRRLSEAARRLEQGGRVLQVALDHGFASQEVFSRAFKRATGQTPGSVKFRSCPYFFQRMEIMDKYYDQQDPALLEKYPDIKVLKELPPQRVVSCRFEGRDPETGAWKMMSAWLARNRLDRELTSMRFFGFNSPDPAPGETEYAYELWATLPEGLVTDNAGMTPKDFSGGLYAVTGVRGGTDQIAPTWQRFVAWLRESRYTWGGHQYLEEHLGLDQQYSHQGGLDLYLPICPKSEDENTKRPVDLPACPVICLTRKGRNAETLVKKEFRSWMETAGLLDGRHWVRATYDHLAFGKPEFWYQLALVVEPPLVPEYPKSSGWTSEVWEGGVFMTQETLWQRNGFLWGSFIAWMNQDSQWQWRPARFFEEYCLGPDWITAQTKVRQHMPVRPRDRVRSNKG